MLTLFRKRFPLRQVVRSLFFNVGLRIGAMCACKLLGDRILDFDALDGLIQFT